MIFKNIILFRENSLFETIFDLNSINFDNHPVNISFDKLFNLIKGKLD